MKKSPLMSLAEFEKLVADGDHAALRRAAIELITRWTWLCQGYIGLPFDEGEADLVYRCRIFLPAAAGVQVPEFPLAPGDYRMTFRKWFCMLPRQLKRELVAKFREGSPTLPADKEGWDAAVIWGQGALGGVPDIYRTPEGGYRAPGTFWDAADRAGGGEGYPPNKFETWVTAQEARVYNDADVLADRKIRAFYAGYRLHRSRGYGVEEIVWEATNLPIPVLSWWSRYWLRAVDSGAEAGYFGSAEVREKTIDAGLEAIAVNGGWPEFPDPFVAMGDWRVKIDFDGEPYPVQVLMGVLVGIPEEVATSLGEKYDAFGTTAAAELQRFGLYTPKPMYFAPGLFGESPAAE